MTQPRSRVTTLNALRIPSLEHFYTLLARGSLFATYPLYKALNIGCQLPVAVVNYRPDPSVKAELKCSAASAVTVGILAEFKD